MFTLRPLCPVVLLIALSPLPVVAQAAPQAQSAEEATPLLRLPERVLPGLVPLVEAAAEAGPAVITARLEKLASEAREEESRSLTRPRADVFGDISYRENSETRDGEVRPYYNVGVEQPIWHWHSLTNQKRIAEIKKKLAVSDYDEARRNLILEIRRAYLDLILQKGSLAGIFAAHDRQRTALRVNRDRAARGEYASDLLATEQLDASKAELARDRAQSAFQRALREFAILNGLETFTAAQLPDGVGALPAGAKALFNPAIPAPAPANRVPAALARPEGELEAARLQQEVTRVRNYPKINLAAGADQGATSGTDQTAVINYFAGVRVRWNIFDGFATRAAVREARAIVRQNEQAVTAARRDLVNQLNDQAEDLALILRELDIAEQRFVLTEARRKVDEDLWKTGRLAETEWQTRNAAAQTESIALSDLRGRAILQLSEHALLSLRATTPSSEIQFP
ncbi:MAG: TolC family protein [Opitutaceae bacterium]|nr:TolC family protein [Opitutaceae bacterium]